MEKVYDRFRERRIQRWKAFSGYVMFFIVVIVVGTYVHYSVEWLMSYWIGIGILGSLVGFFYLVSRPWATETYEIDIFVDVYDASKVLELVSDEEANPSFYTKKASKKLKGAILHIGSLAYKLEQANSTLANEIAVPLRDLEKNLETRILPRVSEKKDVQRMIHVLNGIAQIFGEVAEPISLEKIVSKNKDLENIDVIEVKRQPSRIKTMMSKESVKLFGIIAICIVADSLIVYIHSIFFHYDLLKTLSDLTTFLTFLGFGIAVGAIIYELVKRRT